MSTPHKTAKVFAPAKINLTLHVTGQRRDGYHLLDSIVVFTDVGDEISVSSAERTSLQVTGSHSKDVPQDANNIVLRAANWLDAGPVEILLEKNLPVASGIGGGSSDAAATIRAICDLYSVGLPTPKQSVALGADIPVCLAAQPSRMSGIGENVAPIPNLPPLHFVLVNPGVQLSTAKVFGNLAGQFGDPGRSFDRTWTSTAEFAAWLSEERNDLETSARKLAPTIGVVLGCLSQLTGCLLARMSGSGATCFGLFATREEADNVAHIMGKMYPEWWIKSASSCALN